MRDGGSSPPSDTRHSTVFLSAEGKTELALVRGLLERANLRVVGLEDLPSTDLTTSLSTILEHCDAVVAVIDSPHPVAAVLLEIGAAIGGGRPVVLLVANTNLAN